MEKIERNEKLNIRISKKEKINLEQQASEKGYENVSDYVRDVLALQSVGQAIKVNESDFKMIYTLGVENIVEHLKSGLAITRTYISEIEMTLEAYEDDEKKKISLKNILEKQQEIEKSNEILIKNLLEFDGCLDN